MEQKITIKDVAVLAGVSKSTVSRYLNHGYISLEKQEKVRRAIDETGFKSNFFAKRLKTKESKLIGIVLPRMDSVTVGKLLAGISRILDPAGYQGILLVSQLSGQKELENIRNLQQQGLMALLSIRLESPGSIFSWPGMHWFRSFIPGSVIKTPTVSKLMIRRLAG